MELWATKWVKVIGKAVKRPHCNQMKDERSKILKIHIYFAISYCDLFCFPAQLMCVTGLLRAVILIKVLFFISALQLRKFFDEENSTLAIEKLCLGCIIHENVLLIPKSVLEFKINITIVWFLN